MISQDESVHTYNVFLSLSILLDMMTKLNIQSTHYETLNQFKVGLASQRICKKLYPKLKRLYDKEVID